MFRGAAVVAVVVVVVVVVVVAAADVVVVVVVVYDCDEFVRSQQPVNPKNPVRTVFSSRKNEKLERRRLS